MEGAHVITHEIHGITVVELQSPPNLMKAAQDARERHSQDLRSDSNRKANAPPLPEASEPSVVRPAYNNPMDPAQRDKIWRRVIVILCAVSLVSSALAFYGIKQLEAKSKPRIHLIREVNQYRVEPHKESAKK